MKTLEQLRAERKLTTPSVTPTPTINLGTRTASTTPQMTDIGKQKISSAASTVSRPLRQGLGWVNEKILMPVEYGYAGAVKGAMGKKAEQVGSAAKFETTVPPKMAWERTKAAAKGVGQGLRAKEGISDIKLAETGFGIKNKPVSAALDIATSLAIPSVPVGKIAKLTKLEKVAPVVAKAGLAAAEKVPVLNKVVKYGKELSYAESAPKRFLSKMEEYNRKVSGAAEKASEIATPLKFDAKGKELPKETQRILGDILGLSEGTGRAVTQAELKMIADNDVLVKRTLNKFQKLAEQDIKAGADPKIYERFMGKYYGKKLYETKLNKPAEVSPFIKNKQPRLDLSSYKKRLDIPEEVRRELGQIKEPAYGAALAAYGTSKNIATRDLYKWIAKNYVEKGEDLVTLPKTEKLGILSGRRVPKKIETYLNDIVSPIPDTTSSKIVKLFKEGKTILSPKQLLRNIPASQIQAYMNPSGKASSIVRLPEAIKELKNKGKFYKEAKSVGVVGQTFASNELGKFVPEQLSKFNTSSLYEKLKKPGAWLQNATEEITKLQVFINERKAGKSVIDAAKAAEETGFNYQKVSPLVKKLRSGKANLGPLPFSVPFITYPMKAAELTAKTLYKQPQRLKNIGSIERGVQSLSEPGQEQFLPDYLKEAVRLPAKSKKTGNQMYLNAKYLYPFGNLLDSGTPMGLTPDPILGELVSQFTDRDFFLMTQAIAEGKDPMDVKKLSDSDIMGLPWSGKIRHAIETFGITPIRSLFKVIDAQTKQKISSTTPGTGQAILQEAGVPLYQYSPSTGASIQSYERVQKINDAKAAFNKYLKDAKPGTFGYQQGLDRKRQAWLDAIAGK